MTWNNFSSNSIIHGFKKLWVPLMVQWLRFRAATAGGTGSIPGRGSSVSHAVQPKKKKKVLYFQAQVQMTHSRKLY